MPETMNTLLATYHVVTVNCMTKVLQEGSCYFGSQFKGTIHQGGKVKATGDLGS